MKNTQSRPVYPGASRRQNKEGFLQKWFPWFALVATVLCFWYKLEVTARITYLGWLITLVALAILTIVAFWAKHNGTTINGLWTSWRASREYDDDDEEEVEPPFDMPYPTEEGYRRPAPMPMPSAPAPTSVQTAVVPDGYVKLADLKLADDLVMVQRKDKWIIEPSKEKEAGHANDKYDKLTNTWVDSDTFIQLSIQRGIAEAMGRQ